MHSYLFTTFASTALYAGACLAAPTESQMPNQGMISTVVDHLDSNHEVDWTPAGGDGSRAATILLELVSSAQQNTGLTSRTLVARDHRAKVGHFRNIGRIGNYSALYACEKSGSYGVSSTIEAASKNACLYFLEMYTGAPVAENNWNIYQTAPQPGSDGNQVVVNFRYFYNSEYAPKLTEEMCITAYDYLTSVFCQGKGDRGTATRGGEIQIGQDDDYVMIGFDPNHI